MVHGLSEEEELIRRTVRELAHGVVAKNARQADLEAEFPRANVAPIAEMGLLGVLVDGELGGAGGSAVMLALACEELAAACGATGAFVAMTNAWLTDPLARHGSPEVRDEWLPRLLSGAALGTYGLFEDAVGSDPFRVRTAIHPGGSETEPDGATILSGTKDLVFLAGHADLVLVAARGPPRGTDRSADVLAVPTDREGVTWGGDDGKLGLRGLPTAPLYLVRVPVRPQDRLGDHGDGPAIARRAGQILTIATAACAVGLARAALEASATFATEREQFGSPIARYEAIQHAVAQQRVGCDAARAMVLQAARAFDREGEAPLETEEANIHAFDLARQATRTAIRVHGGAGYMRDIPVERYARDVRTLEVLGRPPDVSRSLVGIHSLQAGNGA